MQTTVKSAIEFSGTGLHSGRPARMVLRPAGAEYGIWFKRTDVDPAKALVPAHWDAVEPTALCTRIVNDHGTSVSTIEHVMAAIAGCGIQNALIEIDGPEVPILDGSSAPFVAAILSRGLRRLNAPIRALEVLRSVEVRNGEAYARLDPCDHLEIDFHIDFPDAAIGVQDKSLNMANGTFVHELCDSRTFCRRSDVETMRAQGLALGGTLENAVVVDGAQVLSPGGLRHEDEAVRHKMLDALGDLALAGAPLLARYTGFRAGHAMTNALLRALFARPGACRMVTCDTTMSSRLPGAGLRASDAPRHP
jgi:UDP-3-O-[3-hydroxymyristoyl] N-acetylglucosamine deacetylase